MDNLQRRQKLAWDLYRDYIAVGAKHELNLDSMSRKVTTLAMITPHLTTFDTARGRIMNLLSNDAYLRFLSWEIYRELAAQTPGPTPAPPTRSITKTSTLGSSSEDLALARLDRPTSLATSGLATSGLAKRSTSGSASNPNDIPLRELT